MRIAFDTNLLVYAEGHEAAPADGAKIETVRALLARTRKARELDLVAAAQVLGELFTVLVRKAGRPPARAREAVLSWRQVFTLLPTTEAVLLDALDLAAEQGLRIWDVVILAAA